MLRFDIPEIYYRLKRRAYICEGGSVKFVGDLGCSGITDAFIARPPECRYCVFETPDGALVVDMWELENSGNPTELVPRQGTTRLVGSVEAAILFAVSTY